MFNDFWGWLQERRRNNLEPAAIPSVESFTTPDIYSTRPTDMPGDLTFTPWLTQKGGYDIAAHEKAKERWAFKEDLRLKQRARLAKLANMKQNLAPGGKYGQHREMVEGLPPASSAPLDVLNPDTKTMSDFERLRRNRLMYGGTVV
jgi:hypothetical protein|tara:strand:- start:801 stop:1238 length:438 start_codon:yes stop_codon:yes gene_type:complete